METKGIVRRLDDLGRIVIPKEYRRMFKIELGDPLEIFAMDNGDIILHRFDMAAMVKSEATLAAEALERETGKAVGVADRERFVAGVGLYKNDVIGKTVEGGVRRAMEENRTLNTTTVNDAMNVDLRCAGDAYFALAPIINNGQAYGCMTLFSNDPVTDEEVRLLKMTAELVAINLQRY